jgi:hypothetical protein
MSNIVPLADIQKMAEVAATSKMFGFKNPQEAMAIMLLCQAENLHPAIAMRDFHVIQGRPALKADAMLARFQQAGGKVEWKVYTDAEVTGVFSHPQGGSLEVTWTLSQAKSIGIANKDNWKNYPRAMLRARCLSEGIRAVYPGCVVGVYTPEEVQDFEPRKTVDMGTAERVDEVSEVVGVEVADGAFHLYVPGSDKPYASYHSTDEWIEGYCSLVHRISVSPKFSDEEKALKLSALQSVNIIVTAEFDSFTNIKLKGEIVKAGGSINTPKSEPLPPTGSELNEPVF